MDKTSGIKLFSMPVYMKPCRSQYNVWQNLPASGKEFGFTCHNDS